MQCVICLARVVVSAHATGVDDAVHGRLGSNAIDERGNRS